jgi:beta-lactamase regulating signal transducer with metallopeptidase domain
MTMHSIFDPVSIARISGQWAAVFIPVTIKGSVILCLAFAATRMLRGRSASARHLAWTLGMVGLLLLPLMESAIPIWRVVPVPGSGRAAAIVEGPRASVPASAAETGEADAALGAAARNSQALGGADKSQQPPSAAAEGPKASSPRALSAWVYHRLSRWVHGRASWTTAYASLFVLWLGGVVALCGSLLLGLTRLRRLRLAARPLDGGGWPELLNSLCEELGLGSCPTLLYSERTRTPMTWGLRRPVVLLPGSCLRWSDDLRREVLLHELAHVRRRDCVLQLLAQLACTLNWLNPLAWLAKRGMRIEREMACDDQVLMAGARPSSYAGHLLEIAAHRDAERHVNSLALAMARRSRIFDRLDAVLAPGARRPAPGRRATIAAIALTLAMLPPLAAVGPSARADEPRHRRAESEGETYLSDMPAMPRLHSLPSLPAIGPTFITRDGGRSEISWTSKSEGVTLKLVMSGKIEFSDDESTIVWMDEDAHLKLEKKRGRERMSIEAEPDAEGRPIYTYKVGRRERPFDDDAAAEMGETLREMMIQMGANAGPRVRAAYDEGGIEGVLDLVESVDSDYTEAIYYRELFSIQGIPDRHIAEALRHMSRDLSSDYELAGAMTSYLDGYAVTAATRSAFLDCMSSIASDYEKGRVLKAALDREDVTHETMAAALEAMSYITSDYEKGQALSSVNPEFLSDEAMGRSYFDAVKSVRSDYEKAEILLRLARYARMDEALRDACLEAADTIDSTYEYGRVAKALR